MRIDISISGCSGFVGKNLLKYLNNYCINKLDRVKINSTNRNLDGFAIIHLAGKAHDLKKTANPEEYYQVNYELTKGLYDAFLKSDATKFIFVSSVKAAADSVDGVLSEERKPNPQTDYGKSKLMAEQYIQSQPLREGKSYYILRPCMIHGPGNKGNLNLLYKVVEKSMPYPLAAFDNQRSFLTVDNLCFVIKSLIEKEIPSGVYHIADDEPLSTNQLIEFIAGSLGRKPSLWRINRGLIKKLASLGDILHLPLNSERLQKLTESYVVSNAKIKAALQIKQLPIAAKEGMINTIKSFINT